MRIFSARFVLAASAVTLGLAGPSQAATNCTDGVDCFCDKVKNPSRPEYTPGLVMCEDFEAQTLHDDTGKGAGAFNYGPWYDDTGYAGARGNNNYWHKTYGSSDANCAWSSGVPASPVVGSTCAFGTCFAGEYRKDDRWGANAFACIDIVRNGEFGDEVSTIASPTVNGQSGVFDGTQSLAARVPATKTSGIMGRKTFSPPLTTFGATMAVGYASNSGTSGVWNQPWKHNEWGAALTGANDGPFLFHNGADLSDQDPFEQFLRYAPGKTLADCQAAMATANVVLGDVYCVNTVALYVRADKAAYNRSRDFPLGSWACVRAEYAYLNTSSASIKIWFNEKLIVDVRNLNTSFLQLKSGYDAFIWNDYSNANQGMGATPTSATTYRYEDNVIVTSGSAPACSVIGFSGTTTSPLGAPGQPHLVP